jgi:uncharacterized protein (TIGR03034 family)
MQSGTIATYGDTFRWAISYVGSKYVIESVDNPGKFLAASATSGNTSMEVVTATASSVPTRAQWTISNASGGGVLIQNASNSGYLTSTGTVPKTTTSLGTPGLIQYRRNVWRILPIAAYHELNFSFTVSDMTMTVGQSRMPVIIKSPTNATWANVDDFTFTSSSGNISINNTSYTITGVSTGVATVTGTHKVTGRTDTFTVYVSKLLIYQTGDTYYYDENGNYAEDLEYNDMSEDDLRALDWVNWIDFVGYTPALHRDDWELMCTTFFSTGELQDVILNMIDHFMDGSGASYSNSTLTQKAFEHNSTQTYISAVESKLSTLLNTYDGDISALEYFASDRESNPLVQALYGTNEPVYNTASDIINGLTICVDGLWGNKIEVTSFNLSENTYTYTLHYTLYDHFGLDQNDVEKYGLLAGFRSWYVLQHYNEYNGVYRPFLTMIEFDVTVSGTYS